MINEATFIEQWLYDRLANDPTIKASILGGRVFRGFPLQDENDDAGSLLPCIRIYPIDNRDIMTMNRHRVWSEALYRVEIMARDESIQRYNYMLARIELLLHRASGSVDGCEILSCHRIGFSAREDDEDAEKYVFVGGDYKILAQANDKYMFLSQAAYIAGG